MYCVYRHVSPSNKVYVGITKDIKSRWGKNGQGYLGKEKNGKYTHWLFAPAILKYGWENFSHEILFENINEISAKMVEEDLIFYYKKENKSYNIADSSFNCSYINNQIPIIQLTYDLEIVAEFTSSAEAGRILNAPSTNITRAVRNKNSCKGFYWIYKTELDQLKTIEFKPNTSIYQLDPNTKQVIKKFNSISDAAKLFDVTPDAIGNAIVRKSKSVGFYWIKEKDLNNISNIDWKLSAEVAQAQGLKITIENISTGEQKSFQSINAMSRWLGYKSSIAYYASPNNMRGWKVI